MMNPQAEGENTAQPPAKPQGKSFAQIMEENPCDGCPAPCCRTQIHAVIPPQDLMSVDHIRFSLLHPERELTIDSQGKFSYVEWTDCSMLDKENFTCKVHGTARQPRTCVHFNPHNCWYKRNFVETEDAPDLVRMNLERFEKWMEAMVFDENDKLIESPNYQELQEMVKDIALNRVLKMNPDWKKVN